MEKKPTNSNSFSGILKAYWMIILGLILILAGRSSSDTILTIAGIVLVILHFAGARKKTNQEQEQPEEPQNQSVPVAGQMSSELPAEHETNPDEWVCEKCGAKNTGAVCEYCDSPREEKKK